MSVSPAFLVCVFVTAEHEQRDLGILCNCHSLVDQFFIVYRVGKRRTVRKPIATLFGYLATFRIADFNSAGHLVFYALQDTHATSGSIAVTTKMNLRSIWT